MLSARFLPSTVKLPLTISCHFKTLALTSHVSSARYCALNWLIGNNPLGWRSLKDLRIRKSLVVIESVLANSCINALMTCKVLVRRLLYNLPGTQSVVILNNYVPNREVNPHLNRSGSTNQYWRQKRTLRSILLRVFTLGLTATTLSKVMHAYILANLLW